VYNRITHSEKKVAEMLKNMGSRWTFEQSVFIWDENNRPRVWTPDFFIIHFGIYVEICGSEVFDYEYRRGIFYKNGYRVIIVHCYKNEGIWKHHLLSYLYIFTKERNQELQKIYRENKVLLGKI
jgi:hypothetical protein